MSRRRVVTLWDQVSGPNSALPVPDLPQVTAGSRGMIKAESSMFQQNSQKSDSVRKLTNVPRLPVAHLA